MTPTRNSRHSESQCSSVSQPIGSCLALRSEPARSHDSLPKAKSRKRALRRVVKGYGVCDAALPVGIYRLRRSWTGHRDRGVGSTKRRQAVLTMSYELELLLGRPYDLPGCAARADP